MDENFLLLFQREETFHKFIPTIYKKWGKYADKYINITKIVINLTWFFFYQKTTVQRSYRGKYGIYKMNISQKEKNKIIDLTLDNNISLHQKVELLRVIISGDRLKQHIESINGNIKVNLFN